MDRAAGEEIKEILRLFMKKFYCTHVVAHCLTRDTANHYHKQTEHFMEIATLMRAGHPAVPAICVPGPGEEIIRRRQASGRCYAAVTAAARLRPATLHEQINLGRRQ